VLWEKNQNQTTVGSGYFKNLREPAVFMKELGKELRMLWPVL
jgi:hypothetical protein